MLQLAVNLLERFRGALLTPLGVASAGRTGLILAAYTPLALGLGRYSGFFLAPWRWPPLGVLLRGSLPLLLMPALGEELLFRVALLPHPLPAPDPWRFWAWGALNVGLFVLYHPLAARLWDRRQPAVFDDPRFADWFLRKDNEAALRGIIETALAAEDAKTWEPRLNKAGAPCASIWKIEEVIDHPQIAARNVLQTVDSPYGKLRLMGSGFQMAHGGGRLDTVGPALGAHSDAIPAEIGYDPQAIADLRQRGVV